MGKFEKIINKIQNGASDKNVRFADLCWMLKRLGFDERISGSHHIFSMEKVVEIINIQPKGNLAKPYQVKQVRELLIKYRLGATDK